MAFEDDDTEFEAPEEQAPPEESGNRAFLIVAGILGALALLALVCIAVYAGLIVPRNRAANLARAATVNAQNTEVALAITQTSDAASIAATAAAASPTPSPTSELVQAPPASPTRTAVLVRPTFTRPPTQNPSTATVAALLTQASNVTRTPIVPTPTALGNTGFADEVGLPMMLGLSLLLLVVMVAARRLRSS